MFKIFRLSAFNIIKSKKEALAIAFLSLVSVLFLGIIVTNVGRINSTFYDSFEASGSYNTAFSFPADKYREECRTILEEEYGIEDIVKGDALFSVGASVTDTNDEKYGINMYWVTPSFEKQIEDFVIRESISEDELDLVAHPIWLPTYFKLNRGFELSDDFNVEINGKEYPFIIVGFYETGLMAGDATGVKCVVSEEDYLLLEPVCAQYTNLFIDSEDFPVSEYQEKCDERTSENVTTGMQAFGIEIEKAAETQFLNMFIGFVGFLSVVTLASAMFLVRHKISNDIEDQMQQIGVLETLGYKSREISLSYVGEYLLSGGIGALIGGCITYLIAPVFSNIISVMIGRTCSSDASIWSSVVVTVLVTIIIVIFALSKAYFVKKLPPVVALRKGIKTHHFGKNLLPIEKLKWNINIRIAMKDFLGEFKSSVGVCICIIISSIAILFAMSAAYFFNDGYMALVRFMGTEEPEVTVLLQDDTDINEINAEISQMSEVRKTLLTYGDFTQFVKVIGDETSGTLVVFDDYPETENIVVSEGRFPEHDNEVMVSVGWRERSGYNVGDSITLQGDASAEKYLITGVVGGMLNGGSAIYMNPDGLTRLNPNATLNSLAVYLNDGVVKEDFENELNDLYGDSVKVGSMLDLAKGQMEPIANITRIFGIAAAIIISGIVAVILGIISVSSVKRKKKDIGIMKSLGYSSKDLMTQMAMRILPPTIVGVGIASISIFYIYRYFWISTFSVEVDAVPGVVVVTGILVIIFCYFVTYISAGRTKKISVTELMTE